MIFFALAGGFREATTAAQAIVWLTAHHQMEDSSRVHAKIIYGFLCVVFLSLSFCLTEGNPIYRHQYIVINKSLTILEDAVNDVTPNTKNKKTEQTSILYLFGNVHARIHSRISNQILSHSWQ